MFAQRGFPFLGHFASVARARLVENKVKVSTSVCRVWRVRWNNKDAVFSASLPTLITHLHCLPTTLSVCPLSRFFTFLFPSPCLAPSHEVVTNTLISPTQGRQRQRGLSALEVVIKTLMTRGAVVQLMCAFPEKLEFPRCMFVCFCLLIGNDIICPVS